ncbi:AsnC family protein [Candidatus Borrarchaeum sp.]|uniref:Lrp/AsnC family transcriptional regulator n=1 Tax=Candidatus Borrarchaeum sp. TaxID=2846742 RepID=UPI003183EFF4
MLDDIDQKIIDLLKKDSRTSFVKIADEVGLSETAIRKRIKNLQESKTIRLLIMFTAKKLIR